MTEDASRDRFTEMFRQLADRVAPDDGALQREIMEFARVVATQGEIDYATSVTDAAAIAAAIAQHVTDYH